MLSDNELAAIIVAARKMPWPYGGIVEFLALTGQRREEVVRASPEEIDAVVRTWCIHAERTKNRKAHIVHLSEPAWAVIFGHLIGKYVFPTSTGHHFQAYSKSKRLLDELSGSMVGDLHDLRRTIFRRHGPHGYSTPCRRQDSQTSVRNNLRRCSGLPAA